MCVALCCFALLVQIENRLIVALLKHSGLWQEAKQVLSRLDAGEKAKKITPSKAMEGVDQAIHELRQWLMTQHELKEREAAERSGAASDSKNGGGHDRDSKTDDDAQADAAAVDPSFQTFKEMVEDMADRAAFLISLAPGAVGSASKAHFQSVLSGLAKETAAAEVSFVCARVCSMPPSLHCTH